MAKELELAKKLWAQLGDTPVNEEEEIDEYLYFEEVETGFDAGTGIYDIWHWFEERFDLSVAKDLMNLKYKL